MAPQLMCPAGLTARASRRGLLAGLLVVAAALVTVALVWDARTALVAVVAVWAVWMGAMPIVVIRRARRQDFAGVTLALTLYDTILFVHIVAVVIGFGAVFSYPILSLMARRDPVHEPTLRRAQATLGARVISPMLLVILLAGIYLASKLHVWGEFWVIFPLVSVFVIGAMGGAVLGPLENRAAELAARDAAGAAPGQPVTMSDEQRAVVRRLEPLQAAAATLVLVVIFVMTTKPFS